MPTGKKIEKQNEERAKIEPMEYLDWQEIHLEEKVERISNKIDEIVEVLNEK